MGYFALPPLGISPAARRSNFENGHGATLLKVRKGAKTAWGGEGAKSHSAFPEGATDFSTDSTGFSTAESGGSPQDQQ
jgi:hypothetical protein